LFVSQGQAALALRGLIVIGGNPMFALCDEATGKDAWLRIGDQTSAGVLTAYDKETGVLAITAADGKVLELTMPASVIQDCRASEPAHASNSVYLSPELRAKYLAEGKNEKAAMAEAIRTLEAQMARITNENERQLLAELVAGAKEGEVQLIETEGRPLKHGEVEGLSDEATDRINSLMKMTPEQVEAMIAEREKSGVPSK